MNIFQLSTILNSFASPVGHNNNLTCILIHLFKIKFSLLVSKVIVSMCVCVLYIFFLYWQIECNGQDL